MLFWMRSETYMSEINLQRGKRTVENRKSREKKRICSEVSVNSPGNPWSLAKYHQQSCWFGLFTQQSRSVQLHSRLHAATLSRDKVTRQNRAIKLQVWRRSNVHCVSTVKYSESSSSPSLTCRSEIRATVRSVLNHTHISTQLCVITPTYRISPRLYRDLTVFASNKDKGMRATQLNSTENYGRRCLTPLSPHRNYTLCLKKRHQTLAHNFPKC